MRVINEKVIDEEQGIVTYYMQRIVATKGTPIQFGSAVAVSFTEYRVYRDVVAARLRTARFELSRIVHGQA